MLPVIHFMGREIGSYSIMAVLGLLTCGVVITFLARRRNIIFANVILAMVSATVGMLIMSHVLYGLVNYKTIVEAVRTIGSISFMEFVIRIGTAFGGAVFYGGFLGGILGIYVFLRIEKDVDKNDLFDLYAVSVPLFHAFGRVGCFLAGCCYGVESHFGFIAEGNIYSPEVNGICRFPVQLAEAGLNIVLFAVLIYLFRRNSIRGLLIFIYLMVYPTYRFALEFFRGDVHRGLWFGLSTSQWISIVLFIIGAIGITVKLSNNKERKTWIRSNRQALSHR